MTSQPGQQTIAIHTLRNMSRSKCNQAVKCGPFIEYDMWNISHTQNVVEKLFPDIVKYQNWAYLDQ